MGCLLAQPSLDEADKREPLLHTAGTPSQDDAHHAPKCSESNEKKEQELSTPPEVPADVAIVQDTKQEAKINDTAAAKENKEKETVWKQHSNPQFYSEYNALPSHLLSAAHHRLSCHDSLRVVHGNQHPWKYQQDEEAINEEHKIWYLDTLCWLEFNSNTTKVPPGRYAMCMRIKLNRFNFHGVWKIGDTKGKKTVALKDKKEDIDDECMITEDKTCILYQHGQGKGILGEEVNKGWVWMYFGDFEIKDDPEQKDGTEIMIHLAILKLRTTMTNKRMYFFGGLGLDVMEIYKLDLIEHAMYELDKCCILLPDIIELILQYAHDINFNITDTNKTRKKRKKLNARLRT
eukprot:39751_1